MNDSRNEPSQIDLMRRFVRQKLELWPEFVAAVVVGSVAHGEARPDSDLDCILIFDSLDEAIIPAEFVWIPATDSFHTIFEVEASEVGGIQIDATRMALNAFRDQEWPESFRHEMAHALVMFDRRQSVSDIIKERVGYPESVRLSRIQEHVGWADYLLEEWRLLTWLDKGGYENAHDQLTVAFEELLKLLHACNREWLPWRHRWMLSAQRLPWQPAGFSSKAEEIVSRIEPTRASLLERRQAIASLLDDTLASIRSEGLLVDPFEAFVASHPGLGYAHNFEAWKEAHQALTGSRNISGKES